MVTQEMHLPADDGLRYWEQAQRCACETEALLHQCLDRYCAGCAPAPSVQLVEAARVLRRCADAAFGEVLDSLNTRRAQLPRV